MFVYTKHIFGFITCEDIDKKVPKFANLALRRMRIMIVIINKTKDTIPVNK